MSKRPNVSSSRRTGSRQSWHPIQWSKLQHTGQCNRHTYMWLYLHIQWSHAFTQKTRLHAGIYSQPWGVTLPFLPDSRVHTPTLTSGFRFCSDTLAVTSNHSTPGGQLILRSRHWVSLCSHPLHASSLWGDISEQSRLHVQVFRLPNQNSIFFADLPQRNFLYLDLSSSKHREPFADLLDFLSGPTCSFPWLAH